VEPTLGLQVIDYNYTEVYILLFLLCSIFARGQDWKRNTLDTKLGCAGAISRLLLQMLKIKQF